MKNKNPPNLILSDLNLLKVEKIKSTHILIWNMKSIKKKLKPGWYFENPKLNKWVKL